MQGESVMYEGRYVLKDGFRAFIYGLNDKKKLVNSWDEYLHHMETGLWVSNIEDIKKLIVEEPLVELEKVELPKKQRRKKGAN